MKCSNCGREIRDGERFCPSCGKPLNAAEADPERKTGSDGLRPEADPGNKPENEPEARPESHPEAEAESGSRSEPGSAHGYELPNDPGAPVPPYGQPQQPQVRQISRGAAVFRAVIAVILFLFLFFGIQSCVIGSYIGSNIDATGVLYAAQNGDQAAFEKAYNELIRSALDLLYDRQAILMLISNLLTILVLCLGFRLRRKNPTDEFALHGINPARLIQFALFGAAMNVLLSVLISLLPLPEGLYDIQRDQYSALLGGSLFVSLFSVAVVGPVTEEIFFRGIPMTRFEPVLGGGGAVILSALFFGLAHGTPIAVGYAFVFGVVLALIYRKYRSILPGIVCHCFFNLTAFWLPEGLEGPPIIALTAVCALVAAAVWYTAMIRYPGFNDILWDGAGRLRSDDPAKQSVIRSVRSARADGSLDMETVERLAKEWAAAEKKDDTADGGDNGGTEE